jgi:hypothetical protein
MKRTEYTVIAGFSQTTFKETWKRVYEDGEGKRYIREGGKYKCIEGTPCISTITRD